MPSVSAAEACRLAEKDEPSQSTLLEEQSGSNYRVSQNKTQNVTKGSQNKSTCFADIKACTLLFDGRTEVFKAGVINSVFNFVLTFYYRP